MKYPLEIAFIGKAKLWFIHLNCQDIIIRDTVIKLMLRRTATVKIFLTIKEPAAPLAATCFNCLFYLIVRIVAQLIVDYPMA